MQACKRDLRYLLAPNPPTRKMAWQDILAFCVCNMAGLMKIFTFAGAPVSCCTLSVCSLTRSMILSTMGSKISCTTSLQNVKFWVLREEEKTLTLTKSKYYRLYRGHGRPQRPPESRGSEASAPCPTLLERKSLV
jgi:hypothetical protein